MHTLAYTVILTDLKAAGLLTGQVEDMLAAEVGALFMPHGKGFGAGVATRTISDTRQSALTNQGCASTLFYS
jgi:Xaa-Pro dipeptidase